MTDEPIIAVISSDTAPDSRKAKAVGLVDRIVMPLFVTAIVAVVAIGGWFAFVRVDPFDPLTYSVQTFQTVDDMGIVSVPTIDGYERPAVYTDQAVPVSGELDVNSDEPVEVLGSVVWVQTQPGGFSCVEREDIPGVLNPGKSIREFVNTIPACVADRVEASGPSMWKITGSVEVLHPGGVTSSWTSEGLWIVPRNE